MNTLTRAELEHYPGSTFTEKLRSQFQELAPRVPPVQTAALRKTAAQVGPSRASHGALPVPRRIDIRRFVGRDRIDRVANYLRCTIPRTGNWSEEALRDVAARLVETSEIVE
ncbi:MAG TPA: hypothetical protein VF395_17745 [Polyangiaceae bacterium]